MSETAVALECVEAKPLRWMEQGFVFEIQSDDQQLLEMARRVFAVRSPVTTDVASRRWTAERANESEADLWIVSGVSETSSMVPAISETREIALLHIEQDALDWLLNNALDTVAVHAALLANNGRGIAIVGPAFAGKSTLATALWRSGWSLMSDDLVFIDTLSRVASPAPRRVSLRFESRDLVGDSAWSEIKATPSCIETSKGLFFHPHEVSGVGKVRTTPLSAIFFLARRNTVRGPAEVCAINPAKAALSLIPYAFNVRTLPFVDGLRRITPLLEWIPAFDLGRGDLQSMVSAIEATVG